MHKIGAMSADDLETLFRGVSEEINKPIDIIEKDFWVCWTLAYLFGECKWKHNMAFKGGTSLSKGFNLISRFSEDIDVILDWRLLGYTTATVMAPRSKTQDNLHVEEMNRRGAEFLCGEFLETLRIDFSKLLPRGQFKLFIDDDPQTICFQYPKSGVSGYGSAILDIIRIEMGANARWTPSSPVKISPYVSQVLGANMENPSVNVMTADPTRTFWEKVTILHKEANRIHGSFPPRYARHYYDLYKMFNSPVKEAAYRNLELLGTVVEFKRRFYSCAWAQYDDAKIGTMKLLPHDRFMQDINRDYVRTQTMMYDDIPSFEDVMQCIKVLESEINSLQQI